jgi:hypothetical protein
MTPMLLAEDCGRPYPQAWCSCSRCLVSRRALERGAELPWPGAAVESHPLMQGGAAEAACDGESLTCSADPSNLSSLPASA